MSAQFCSECQRGENFRQARTNVRSNHDSVKGIQTGWEREEGGGEGGGQWWWVRLGSGGRGKLGGSGRHVHELVAVRMGECKCACISVAFASSEIVW